MTPDGVKMSAVPRMAVVLNGIEHMIEVEPGPDGRKKFERDIRTHFNLLDSETLDYTFDCEEPPVDASKIKHEEAGGLLLEGVDAYDAAFHCASVTAAVRGHARS